MDYSLSKISNSDFYKGSRKRKTRSSAGERNFMCGCGKAYLSYPALYTHVKNKHDGIFPEESQSKGKKPKTVDEDSEILFTPSVSRFFYDFENFVNQVKNAATDEKRRLTESTIEQLFYMLDSEVDKNVNLLKIAMKSMLQLDLDREKFNKIKRSLNINEALSFFFISIYPYCNYKFSKEYLLLIYMITKALNEKGDIFFDKIDKNNNSDNLINNLFTESSDFHAIAEIFNLFIAKLFTQYFKTLKEDRNIDFIYIGFEDDNIRNLILMCKYLANWLFHNELIDYRLEINIDLN